MKRKVVLLLAVMLIAILAVALLVSCNPAKTLDSFIDDYDLLYKDLAQGKYEIVNKNLDLASNGVVDKERTNEGMFIYFNGEDENLAKILFIASDKTIDAADFEDATTTVTHMFWDIDDVILADTITQELVGGSTNYNFVLYDSYGTVVVNVSFSKDSDGPELECIRAYEDDDEDVCYATYKLTYIDAASGNEVYQYLNFKEIGETLKYAPDFVGYKADEVGQSFTSYTKLYKLDEQYGCIGNFYYTTKYNGYTCAYTSASSKADTYILYNEKGKEKATTVIPSDYSYICSLDSFVNLYKKQTQVVAGNKDYDFTTNNGSYKLQYFTANLLTGKVKEVNINYFIDKAVGNSFSYALDEHYNTYVTKIGNAAVVARKIEDKIVSSERSYLLLNKNGTVKSNVTNSLEKLDIFGTITKLSDTRYLIVNDSDSFIADEKLEKLVEVNLSEIWDIDYTKQIIIGKYKNTQNGKTYIGSVDFDGKIVTPFIYTNPTILSYGESGLFYEVTNTQDQNKYVIDFATGKVIIKVGTASENGSLVNYGTALCDSFAYYYKNSLYQNGESYCIKMEVYTLEGEQFATLYSAPDKDEELVKDGLTYFEPSIELLSYVNMHDYAILYIELNSYQGNEDEEVTTYMYVKNTYSEGL